MRALVRMLTAAIAAAGLVSAAPLRAAAQDTYPNRPLTVIVPYAAGGPTDVVARLLGEHMAKTLGQQIVVENVTGAGGTIGAARAARAAPDGYTLLLHQVALAAGDALYPRLPYDTRQDFAGVGLVNYGPMVIVGRKDLPGKTLSETVDWIRRIGTGVSFAHAGAGSISHLCGVLFVAAASAKVNQVPYRGGGPAINDVLAGHVDLFCGQSTGTVEQIQAGTVRGVAVTAREPLRAIPNVPTLAGAGFANAEVVVWHGLFAPRATPAPIVERLNGALKQALADPQVVRRFAEVGADVYPLDQQTPAAAEALLAAEVERWGALIRANAIAAN